MNNCRAGLYSFASTMAWLHKTGIASPPSLVMLGLTLPDSRILCGIASIGLTLANIAIILPYLRQPLLDSIYARQGAPADEQRARECKELSLGGSNTIEVENPILALVPDRERQNPPTTKHLVGPDAILSPESPPDRVQHSSPFTSGIENPAELNAESLVFAPVPSPDIDHQSPPVIPETVPPVKLEAKGSIIASVSSANAPLTPGVRSMVAEPSEYLNIDHKLTPHTTSPLPIGTTDGSQTPSQICRPPEVDSPGISSNPLMRDGRSVHHIPLPAPDTAEMTFDIAGATFSEADLQEQNFEAECDGYRISKNSLTDGVKDTVRAMHSFIIEDAISSLPDVLAASGGTDPSGQTEPFLAEGQESLLKRRSESLEFIPQSVISRYPSVPLVSARPPFEHQAIIPGNIELSHILVQNPEVLLEGARPRARYTTLEGHWPAPFLTEIHPTRQGTGGTFVTEPASIQETLEHGPISLPDPLPVHELTSLRKHPIHRRRLGVLARAALRSRRTAARRYGNSAYDDSSTSDSESESDSESQFSSSGSSADESMLPHMLGADLIAAIDYNSESELNNLGSGKTMPTTPLDVYCDFLASEDSAADISMIMHVSTLDGASSSEVRAAATSRALTSEDIQQWATGVVQKCVRQVCRNRAPMEPLSPSQASDVCAERPSGAGISQCPLSGLHCKLGAATSTHAPTSRVKDSSGPPPPTPISQDRKLLSIRNIRDIPEFVPRQRRGESIAGRVEIPGTRKVGARSTIVMHDAAAEVIARMESQAGFNARQRLAGTSEEQMVGMTAGWQDATRCA